MEHHERKHSWQSEHAEWEQSQQVAYQLSQANSRLIRSIVEHLQKAGIDLQPLIHQHQEEVNKIVHPTQNQK
jgi:hypothetical protein